MASKIDTTIQEHPFWFNLKGGYSHMRDSEGVVYVCVKLPDELYDAIEHPAAGLVDDLKVISVGNVCLFVDRLKS